MSYKTETRNDQPQILTRRQAAALLLAPALLAAPFLSATAGEGTLKLTAGTQPLPFTALMTQSGQFLQLTDMSGQALLVNFWASWCAPCRAEHSTLMAIQENGYHIIGVNYKDVSSKAEAFLTELGNPYIAIGSDASGKTAINWGVYGIPETFLLDKDNKILLRIAGPITRTIYENELKEYLEP